MIFDFSFGGRTENGHEMVFELVSGADLACVLHHFLSLTCLTGFGGQVFAGQLPKTETNIYILVSYYKS